MTTQTQWVYDWASVLALVETEVRSFRANTLILAALVLVLLVLVIWLRLAQNAAVRWKDRFSRAKQLIEQLKPEKGLDNNLSDLLEQFDREIAAQVYAFYVFDKRNRVYLLKAVRHSSREFGKVRPSYSGLAGYKKEEYHPPLSLPAETITKRVERIVEGEVPLLSLPIGGQTGLVRIGPTRGKLRRRQLKQLDELGQLMGHGVEALLDMERIRSEAEVVVASGTAVREISHIAVEPQAMISLMLRLAMQTIGAMGGCYLIRRETGWQAAGAIGLREETADRLAGDRETIDRLEEWIATVPYRLVKRGDDLFYDLPDYLAGTGFGAIAVVAAQTEAHARGMVLIGFGSLTDREAEQAAASTLGLIHEDLREVIGHQAALRRLSNLYTGVLKGLAQMLDNLGPYTIGYSEMMSRYSIMLAKELGLPEDEIRDIALAAYLSNIGMFGISTELYQKEGQYTEQEFQLMKLHAEVGASIIRTTIGNERVAAYILEHHERMDGNGYPGGLKGEDITVGARIIAVVQTFLAKINGRKYRAPLPFHQALQTLRAASGAQLDSYIVERFIGWFERKQRNPSFNARSLGSCWEMCCVPSSVCEHCPAYQRTDVNCWELETNNCKAHGKSCETCFVKTEFLHRAEALAKSK